jgi:hypothetical protein
LTDHFYVSQQIISERTDLLLEHARELLNSDVIPKDRVDLAEHRIPLIADGYFLLNQAYKEWRMPGGHFTELPKIAALQSIVIARLQPFFPIKYPVDEADIGVIKCNEIFAFSYGMGILERSFTANTHEKIDFWLRVLDVVTSSSCETIEPYIVDRKLQIRRPLGEYASINSVLERDRPVLNSLICIFELLSGKGDRIRPGASAT